MQSIVPNVKHLRGPYPSIKSVKLVNFLAGGFTRMGRINMQNLGFLMFWVINS